MIVLALVLLIIVLVFSVAIVLSNPEVYPLSLFRVLVPVTSAGVFFTGFGAALVTIIAVLLLRTGLRRRRETRRRLRSVDRPAPDAPAVTGAAGAAGHRSERAAVADPDPTDRDDDRPGGSATRPTSSGSNLHLDPGEDATTVPVDQRTARRNTDDRDDPRT